MYIVHMCTCICVYVLYSYLCIKDCKHVHMYIIIDMGYTHTFSIIENIKKLLAVMTAPLCQIIDKHPTLQKTSTFLYKRCLKTITCVQTRKTLLTY